MCLLYTHSLGSILEEYNQDRADKVNIQYNRRDHMLYFDISGDFIGSATPAIIDELGLGVILDELIRRNVRWEIIPIDF